jgi:hypothetical protein
MLAKVSDITLSIDIFSSHFFTVTQNSSHIKLAVSKSIEEVTQAIILFVNNVLISSHNGTHIFSENSFTVILFHIKISCFFTRVADAFCCFGAPV